MDIMKLLGGADVVAQGQAVMTKLQADGAAIAANTAAIASRLAAIDARQIELQNALALLLREQAATRAEIDQLAAR